MRSKSGFIIGFVYLAVTAFLILHAGSDVGGMLAIIFTIPWSVMAFGLSTIFGSTWAASSQAYFFGTLVFGASINAVLIYFIGSQLEKIFYKLKEKAGHHTINPK